LRTTLKRMADEKVPLAADLQKMGASCPQI
jgi:hypothetical protein